MSHDVYNSASITQALHQRPAYRVAVTGHQQLGDSRTVAFVRQRFGERLADLRDAHPEGLVVLSGLAAGADLLSAEVAIRGGIPVEGCLATPNIAANFASGPERERFLTTKALCSVVHYLPYQDPSGAAYMALGRWLVDSCDLLIAMWNGLPAVAEGGTGDVVAYALSRRRPVVHIHTVQHVVLEL